MDVLFYFLSFYAGGVVCHSGQALMIFFPSISYLPTLDINHCYSIEYLLLNNLQT